MKLHRILAPCVIMLVTMATQVLAADPAKFSFAPAPVNLSGQAKSGATLSLLTGNVKVDNADDIKVLDVSAQYKLYKGSSAAYKYYAHAANLSSNGFDSGNSAGLGMSGSFGSNTGFAGLFGAAVDVASFESSVANAKQSVNILLLALEAGVQYHQHINDDLAFIPWFKFATAKAGVHVKNTCSASSSFCFNVDDYSSTSYSYTTFGFDLKYRSNSLGMLYQNSKGAKVMSIAFSMDI